jgi:Fuc2NAc and GlcNAc transferase
MGSIFAAFGLLALVSSFGIVYAIRRWALQHMLDIPNERSSHTIPIPRGGGLGIVLATLILFIIAELSQPIQSSEPAAPMILFIAAAALIAALGWADDRWTLSARLRLLLQAGIAIITLVIVHPISRIELPLLRVITFAPFIACTINLVWVVGLTNIYNFMDGIDGLGGFQALAAGGGWFGLLLTLGDRDLALYALLLAGSSLGFLCLNRPRALIFMGDVGSTFIGFSLALLPLLANARSADPRLLGAGVLFVAPFVLDGMFTILRRALRHQNVLTAHRTHIYQRLTVLGGYSHLHITVLYGLYALASVGCGWLYATTASHALMALAILVPIAIFAALVIWTMRFEKRRR